jgi:glutaredoxin
MEPARITLLIRPGCHLCDFAREALARVRASTGVAWVEVDVESDPELEHSYGGRVPVVLLDGAEHDYFRVDEERLRRDLGPPPRPAGGAAPEPTRPPARPGRARWVRSVG